LQNKASSKVSDPQSTLHTLDFGPGETVVLPDLQFLAHSGRSTIYSFFFLFRQRCFKSQGRLKDDSSIQQHSIFAIGAVGVYWHITYFDITRRYYPSGLGSAHKTVFRNSHTIFTVLFTVACSAIHENPLMFLPLVRDAQSFSSSAFCAETYRLQRVHGGANG
jgi:hypothetical protein